MAAGARLLSEMGHADKVLEFRLNIDVEYQGWILILTTFSAMYLLLLPCACAGSSLAWVRRLAAWTQHHRTAFFVTMFIFDTALMYLVVSWLPDWTFELYVETLAKFGAFVASNMVKWASSLAIIGAFVFVLVFKDRILLLLGLDHRTLFKCKLRDVLSCWSGNRFRAIELMVWKVEDLQSADIFSPNSVYVEVYFGYNESMKTRVHNNSGNDCILKETMQLNFDEDDDDEHMYVFVRNQKVVGGSELGRLEIKGDQVAVIEKQTGAFPDGAVRWENEYFVHRRLIPRGTIWFRVNAIDDADAARTC